MVPRAGAIGKQVSDGSDSGAGENEVDRSPSFKSGEDNPPHFSGKTACRNKKHLKNVGPIRHCEPPHAALPFTRCRYCGVARRLRIDVYNDDDDDDDNDNA